MGVVAPPIPWQRSLWLMVAIRTAMSMAFNIAGPFLPFYLIELGVRGTADVELWAGVISSSNFLTSALLSPFWGSLSDRIGRKPMVVRSSIAACTFLALAGVCHNVWQLLVLQMLAGIFGGFSAATMALVGATVPEERMGFSLGWLATGQLVGTLIGPLIGGLIADHFHDYRIVYYFSASTALVVTLLCIGFVTERFQRPAETKHAPSRRELFLETVRHPILLPLLGIIALTQVSALAPGPVIPLFVQSMLGDTGGLLATAAGAAIAVMGVADVLASPWLGKRSDKIGYRRVLIISLLGAAAFTIPQAFTHDYWIFIALRFGLGMFLGGILPAANALAGRLFPRERRGHIFGLISSATFVGMFVGPLLGGSIAAHFGFAALFLTVGAIMLVNFGLVLGLHEDPKDVRVSVGKGRP
jgi:DHA1 family multidrug resistance protein-like MFS transporter